MVGSGGSPTSPTAPCECLLQWIHYSRGCFLFHPFQPSFFSKASCFPTIFGGFIERKIFWKEWKWKPPLEDVNKHPRLRAAHVLDGAHFAGWDGANADLGSQSTSFTRWSFQQPPRPLRYCGWTKSINRFTWKTLFINSPRFLRWCKISSIHSTRLQFLRGRFYAIFRSLASTHLVHLSKLVMPPFAPCICTLSSRKPKTHIHATWCAPI